MNIATKLVVLAAVTSLGANAVVPANVNAATAETGCTVEAVGTKNTSDQAGSKFTVKDGKITGTFKVTGKNCKEVVSLVVWETVNASSKPMEAQRVYKHQTDTFAAGTHTLTVELPTVEEGKVKGCFYQADLVKGAQVDPDPSTPGYEYYGKSRTLGWAFGGTATCEEEVPETPENPENPETPTPETPKPEAPAPETLPDAGPAALVATVLGATGAGTLAHRFVTRKFNR